MPGTPGSEREEIIRQVEQLAYRAWPAAEVLECDGWRFRSTQGVTHRANSVWPNGAGGALTLERRIALAEEFYAARGRPAIFQLCPAAEPPDLDAELERRGYRRGRDTAVLVAPLERVLSRPEASPWRITLTHTCDERWVAAYRAVEGVEPAAAGIRAGIMRRIEPATTYAVAWMEDAPCAVGSAVCEDGWMGLFNLATAPAHRRQGAALAVLRALAGWAWEGAARDLYLQVMYENLPALALYRRLGVEPLHDYHYRTLLPIQEAG